MLPLDQLSKAWDEHADRLLLIARSLGELGEDAAQEAFLALARQTAMPDQPLAWLIKVARNQVLQWQRSEQRRARHQVSRALNSTWLAAGPRQDHVDATEASEVLRGLPTELAEVVTMHLWGQLTFEQIAEVIGSSKSTVHRRYTEAIQLLRQRFSCRIED